MSWRQLGIHDKPLAFLNTNNFYAPLWRFIQDGIENGFISKKISHACALVETPMQAIEFFEKYIPSAIDKETILNGKMNVGNADWHHSG